MLGVRRLNLPFASTCLPLLLSCGCSAPKLAVRMTVPILENTSDAALRLDDTRLVGDALPTSLLLLEGMLVTDPDQARAATLSAMLYFSYAFAYVEGEDPARASRLYERGCELGWMGFGRKELSRAIREGTFDEVRAAIAKVRKKDVEPLLWVAANWGMWIQQDLADTRAAADLARLMPLAERVAELDEGSMWGLPRILLGALHAGRPVMLGGNAERSLSEFERAFAISERNMLLAQVLFAKTYCVLTFDREAFESSLREVLDAPKGKLPDAELLNEIARLQAAGLLARAETIFE